MQRHVFDMNERATHELVARQLRDLADQFASGSVDLDRDESHTPTVIVDPVDVTVDLTQDRHRAELAIRLRWSTG
jgi:amphi-Trp domain-containing protein